MSTKLMIKDVNVPMETVEFVRPEVLEIFAVKVQAAGFILEEDPFEALKNDIWTRVSDIYEIIDGYLKMEDTESEVAQILRLVKSKVESNKRLREVPVLVKL